MTYKRCRVNNFRTKEQKLVDLRQMYVHIQLSNPLQSHKTYNYHCIIALLLIHCIAEKPCSFLMISYLLLLWKIVQQ